MVEHLSCKEYPFWYDESRDAFISQFEESPEPTAENCEVFEGRDVVIGGKVLRVYPIGHSSWVWEIEEEGFEDEDDLS